MPNLMNRKMLREYEKKFSALDAAIFLKFEKHTTEQDRDLRKSLRKEKVPLTVVKNRIARRALAEKFGEGVKSLLKGPIAVAYGDVERTVAAAKVLDGARRAKSIPGIEVRGGFLQGSILSVEQVKALVGLPSRKELLALIVGSAVSPAAQVPTLAQSALATPAQLVAALIEKREKEAAPETPA